MSIDLTMVLGLFAWVGLYTALKIAKAPGIPRAPRRPKTRLVPLPETIWRYTVPPDKGGPAASPLGAEIFLHLTDDYRHTGAPNQFAGVKVEATFPARGAWPADLRLRIGDGSVAVHLEEPELYRDICEAVGSGLVEAPTREAGVAFLEAVAAASAIDVPPPAADLAPEPLPVRYFGGPTEQECDVLTVEPASAGASTATRLLLFRLDANHAHLVADAGAVAFLELACGGGTRGPAQSVT